MSKEISDHPDLGEQTVGRIMCIGIVEDLTQTLGRPNMSVGGTHLVLGITVDDNFASFVKDRGGLRQNRLENYEQTL